MTFNIAETAQILVDMVDNDTLGVTAEFADAVLAARKALSTEADKASMTQELMRIGFRTDVEASADHVIFCLSAVKSAVFGTASPTMSEADADLLQLQLLSAAIIEVRQRILGAGREVPSSADYDVDDVEGRSAKIEALADAARKGLKRAPDAGPRFAQKAHIVPALLLLGGTATLEDIAACMRANYDGAERVNTNAMQAQWKGETRELVDGVEAILIDGKKAFQLID